MQVEPASLAFGEVTIGQEATRTFVVRNGGGAPIDVSAASDDSLFDVKPASTTIPGGGQASFTVTFAPLELGEVAATIHVASNASEGGHAQVAVTGEGIAAAVVVSPKDGIDFGDVARDRRDTAADDPRQRARQKIRIVNAGNDTFRVTGAELVEDADGAFSADLSTLVGSYAKAEAKEAEVIFNPPVLGNLEGAVRITTDSPSRPEIVLPLRGRGIAAVMRLCTRFDDEPFDEVCLPEVPQGSGAPELGWNFGNWPDLQGRSGRIVVRNEGNVPLRFTGMTYAPASPDITFWMDEDHTVAADFATLRPVICPDGVEDEACTHDELILYVEYRARGSVCCLDGVAECVDLAPGGDCSAAANSDVGMLSLTTDDPIWRAVTIGGTGGSVIPVAVVGNYNGNLFLGDQVRLELRNDGDAPLVLQRVFLADPDEQSCAGGPPCDCASSSSPDCIFFRLDADFVASLPVTLQAGESLAAFVDFLDPNRRSREIDFWWDTSDPVHNPVRSRILVMGQGVRDSE